MSHRSTQIERSKQRTRERMLALQKTLRAHDAALREEAKKKHHRRMWEIAKFMDQLGLFGYDDATLKRTLMRTAEHIEYGASQDEEPEPMSDDSDPTERYATLAT